MSSFWTILSLLLVAARLLVHPAEAQLPRRPLATAPLPPPVTTAQYSNLRQGVNYNERILTPGAVRSPRFKKLYTVKLAGHASGQPLFMPAVLVGGRRMSLVFVATRTNQVYALDHNSRVGAIVWRTDLNKFLGPTARAAPPPNFCADPEGASMGILSTPVIDPAKGVIYVVAHFLVRNTIHEFRLFGLNIANGLPVRGSPSPPFAATGRGGGSFLPSWQLQRVALTLVNGRIYIGFAANCDKGPARGWIFVYDAATFRQALVWTSTSRKDSLLACFWQSGAGFAVVDNALFAVTGNGDFNTTLGNWGTTVLKFSLPTFRISSYFTPGAYRFYNGADLDIGSSGPVVFTGQPGGNRIAILGKWPRVYVASAASLGGNIPCREKWQEALTRCRDPPSVQAFDPKGASFFTYGTGAYWQNRAKNTSYYFVDIRGLSIQRFLIANGRVVENSGRGGVPYKRTNFPAVVVSSNGGPAAVVWHLYDSSLGFPKQARMEAYDAGTMTKLFSTGLNGTNSLGSRIKFVFPLVIGGKVYVPSQRGINVFGLA